MLIEVLHDKIIEEHKRKVRDQQKRRDERKHEKFLLFQQKKQEFLQKQKQIEDPDSIVSKRCTAGNLFIIQFGICQHLVHPSCVHKNDFFCPIDRSFKNGFLPNIDDLEEDLIYDDKANNVLSTELKESIELFLNKYLLFFKYSDEKIVNVFVDLVKSISGLIMTYEVRLRSLPSCLDSKKTKILSRNLFLTTWYAYRMKGKPVFTTGFTDDVSENVDKKLTVFQRFIRKLIETDEIEKSEILKNLVSSFISTSFNHNDEKSEKEMLLFLRRVCLADHFLLKKQKKDEIELKSTEIIDWDDVLSLENLSQKFNLPFDHLSAEFEFRPFVFSKIPKEFLRFAEEPFNFPVEQTKQTMVFNMLDYNFLIDFYDDFLNE